MQKFCKNKGSRRPLHIAHSAFNAKTSTFNLLPCYKLIFYIISRYLLTYLFRYNEFSSACHFLPSRSLLPVKGSNPLLPAAWMASTCHCGRMPCSPSNSLSNSLQPTVVQQYTRPSCLQTWTPSTTYYR